MCQYFSLITIFSRPEIYSPIKLEKLGNLSATDTLKDSLKMQFGQRQYEDEKMYYVF